MTPLENKKKTLGLPFFKPSTGSLVKAVFEPLEQRQLMSTVQIFAAGNVGAEQIDLSIGGAVVKHFGNLGSGADAGRFVTLSHTVNGPLAASDVRVSFVNDFYDEARDIDHNVRIDAIAIDGVFYQSESPDTFSTGTYRPQDEIVPGFGRGDMLHTNGYFQYSGSTPPVDPGTGSVVKVFAAGEAGQEQIALQIDGSTVKTWGGLGTGADAGQFVTKSYTSAATLTPGQVRVAFVNDAFDATRNVDYNARVDAIEIDGVRYESESSNTFSTGTWLPADEFTAGFGRGDTLHTNGYFEYGASTQPRRAGRIQWVDRTYRVNESAGQVDIQIQRVDGTDGEVSANFVMINETATPGQDFTAPSGTVKFRNGQSTATVTIPILDDALIEGDESFSVSLSAANGGAVLGAPRTRRVEITDNETQVLGNGLLGEYFRRRDFSDLVVRRNDAIVNFEWGTGSPSPLLPADRFAVRWSGQVLPPTTETYTFRTHSDEGVRLWVNGQLVIDKFVNQTARSHTAQVALQAGQKADIVLEYYEHLGDATARLFWSTPTRTESIIPKAVLFSPDAEPVIPPAQFKEEVLLTGLQNPTDVAFTPDGTAYLLSKEGYIQVYRNGELSATRFVDISGIVNKRGDRGGISIAVHPDFANKPYIYMAYTYEPPEAQSHTGLAGPDGGGNRAARVSRFTADAATGFTTALPGSEVVILGTNSTWENISHPELDSTNVIDIPMSGLDAQGNPIRDFVATDSLSHTIAGLEFGPDGNLYVSTGDASSYGSVDPRTARVQNIDNLSGKVLRIDPITGKGIASNPFANGDLNSNRSKVYAYGLRNPFRISVNPETGRLYIGDVGWGHWEEINLVSPNGGDNFGWPYYEGGTGGNLKTRGYQNTPEAQAFYASNPDVTAPLYARSHFDGARAITLGDFYAGTRYPGFENALFFSDVVEGALNVATLAADGSLEKITQVSDNGALGMPSSIRVSPDGYLYYTDVFGSTFGRIKPV